MRGDTRSQRISLWYASIKSIDQKTFAHLTSLLNACYYLANNNRPFSDFKELVDLLSKCGVIDSEKYVDEKKCQEFVTEIARAIYC